MSSFRGSPALRADRALAQTPRSAAVFPRRSLTRFCFGGILNGFHPFFGAILNGFYPFFDAILNGFY
jgi:hypothetical protein